ncbi:glycosyltransferase family A protein [Halobacteriovorax sp. RZ-1]|uniref:glycosyltransferase family 2 protein n=1 Tax=unclassified Halobacteriovorax TaxID=2639665 RepID=UPI00371773B3
MLVSVIIPTYNRAMFLARAIDSVLRQSFQDFELIVIDDGSTDNSKQTVESYSDSRIKYFFQENRGVSAARNLGVKKSSGKYIAFLDSDDEWKEDKLEKQLSLLDSSKHRLCHTGELWLRDGEVVKQKKAHQKVGGDMFIRSLKNCVISPSSVLLERTLFEEMNGFNESFIVCEDYDLWLKITSLYEIAFLEEAFVIKHAGHDDQLSFKFFAMDYWRVKAMAWAKANRQLSQERVDVLTQLCLKKCQYLIKGYEKYENFENYDEVRAIENYISN